jgi:hypothetical protein
MADTIVVTCPNCKKQLKGPADLQGKKIRCKSCGHTFAVNAPAARQKAPAGDAKKELGAKVAVPNQKAGAAKPPTTPAAPSPAKVLPIDSVALRPVTLADVPPIPDDSSAAAPALSDSLRGPYSLTQEEAGVKRCPQCAFEMPEEAIICLECGFNTQTRARLATVVTYGITAGDRIAWLMPGIICATVFFMMVGVIVFCWLILPDFAAGGWWGGFAFQLWGSIIAAGIGWFTGRYAFKRLILNPHPPEQRK